MQPSESAVTICKIMVGLRVQPEETSARNDVQSAFLGLGSERTPEEFSDGVTYAVAQEWVIEVNGDTLKISRTGWSAPAEVCIRYFRASECDDNSHVLHKGAAVDTTARAL